MVMVKYRHQILMIWRWMVSDLRTITLDPPVAQPDLNSCQVNLKLSLKSDNYQNQKSLPWLWIPDKYIDCYKQNPYKSVFRVSREVFIVCKNVLRYTIIYYNIYHLFTLGIDKCCHNRKCTCTTIPCVKITFTRKTLETNKH